MRLYKWPAISNTKTEVNKTEEIAPSSFMEERTQKFFLKKLSAIFLL